MKRIAMVLGMAAMVLGAAVLDGTAAQIDLYVNGQLVGTTTSMSYSWNTRNLPNGEHVLTAIYRDDQGNTIASEPVRVKVSNALGGAIGFRPPLLMLTVGGATRATLGASESDASRALMIEGRRGAGQALVLSSDVAEASIIDLKGRTVWQRHGDGLAAIDGAMGPSGLYIMAVRENDGSMHHFRVMVVR